MIVTICYSFDEEVSNYFSEFQEVRSFKPMGCLTTFPIFVFSFTAQLNLLQCYEELELPSLRRMHKVLAKQHFVCFMIYLFIGIFGYLSFPLDDADASSYIVRYDALKNFPVLVVNSYHPGSRFAHIGHLRGSTV
jgi:amino acid permease